MTKQNYQQLNESERHAIALGLQQKQSRSVDQVVHDCGDLCQAITDLAFERDALFSIDEYRTLNRCLDNAIADAVSEFSAQRDAALAAQRVLHENQQLGFLMHELRNALGTASLAATAMEIGNLTPAGATGAVLRRSHAAMASLISNALAEVSIKGKASGQQQLLSLAAFIADAKSATPTCMQPRKGAASPWPMWTRAWASRSTTTCCRPR